MNACLCIKCILKVLGHQVDKDNKMKLHFNFNAVISVSSTVLVLMLCYISVCDSFDFNIVYIGVCRIMRYWTNVGTSLKASKKTSPST